MFGLLIAAIFSRIGAKRVIGGFDSFFLTLFLFPIGIYLVLKSRKLDDEEMNQALIEEFKPVNHQR